MARQPRVLLGTQMAQTTPTKGGHYHDLLAQFSPQSSSESATKTRRASAQGASNGHETVGSRDGATSKHMLRPQPQANQPHAESLTDSPEPESPPSTIAVEVPRYSERSSRSRRAKQEEMGSEDELAPSAHPPRKTSARIQAHNEELKMEKRRKERENVQGLRRGTRERKSMIIESDTMPSPPSTRRKAPAPPKLDTARARLRDDIAHRSKAKSNNFLVANKDLFLPLLPETNQVAKLVRQDEAQPIVDYKELTEQPKGVTATMKPYQLSGLSFLVHLYNNGFSGILGDEMGLGKTLQTLSLFQYLEELDQKNGVESEELRPYLVVCPLSVLNSWVTEAQKWVPQLKVLRFHGASTERARLKKVAVGMEDMKGNETSRAQKRKATKKAGQKLSRLNANDHASDTYKIIVTTYDTFHAEQSWFKMSFLWRYVVLDEGHKIKSSVTQISTALRNINSEYRLILTGTPLQNNLLEMWSLLAWLYPDVFTNNTETLFKDSFDLNKGKVNRKTMDDARSLLELIMLRRMKDTPSVNLGLPPKEEILLHVPLTPLQKLWYTRLLTRMDEGMLNELFADGKEKEKEALEIDAQEETLLRRVEELDKTGVLDKPPREWEDADAIIQATVAKEVNDDQAKGAWKKLMNLVMQLRKCCSHPYLLPGVAPDPYYLNDHVIRASGKFILLEKLLKHTVFEQGKKVLIFSGFTRTLDYCEDLLSLISNRGEKFRHLRLDGRSARARRNLDIRLFNQVGSEYKVMLLSTRAGGLGINLTSAQDVIFLDEDWNPQITLQAEARAHRIGQTKKVTIYKLCTQGTVEEQMMGRIRKKLYLSAKITESMQNIHGAQAVAKANKKGRASLADDMPHMDTTQLKNLVRRGAQTLSHPEIDAKEMSSWDLNTMLAKCRDKGLDAVAVDGERTDLDEEKWLSTMERVECAVFDGKRYQRQLDKDAKAAASIENILPDEITRADRRRGKNTTVMVDGYAIAKQSMDCADWEAVPTLAGKDPRLAEPVREKRRDFSHEPHCLSCFEDEDAGQMVTCKSCPRSYHVDCLDPAYRSKVKGFSGFFCPQHNCTECGKNTTDAGGLIFRCRFCPQGFCEDCLDWDNTELIGENLPEFEVMEEAPTLGGFYVKCHACKESCDENEEHKAWMRSIEDQYKDQHDDWMKERAEAQRQLDQQMVASDLDNSNAGASARLVLPILNPSPVKKQTHVLLEDTDATTSPPALTDTSLPTPALSGSRVGTPKRSLPDEYTGESRKEKKSKLDVPVVVVD